MHFRLQQLELIFASVISGRRDASAYEHALSTWKIAAHICRQVEPNNPNSVAARVQPSAGESAHSRAAHRPLDNLAEVALENRHDAGSQIFVRSALAPVLVSSRE